MSYQTSTRPINGTAARLEPAGKPLLAFAWMMGAVASFALMAVAGREIQVEMNTFELMLCRSFIGFAVVAAVVATTRRGFRQVRSPTPFLHVRRNLWHYAGQNLWFYAVAAIPLSQLVALEFTNPLWVALIAPFMLGENLTREKIIAIAIGFLGVLVVARPGVSPLEWGHVAGLLAAAGFAMNTIYTKQIMRFDSVLCVLFWMTLSQGLMSLVLSLPGGIPAPSGGVAPWLVVVGLTGLTAPSALTSALSYAPASIVAPMEFLRLPVLSLVGVWLYAEALHPAVLVGAVLILIANFVNLRASRSRKAAQTPSTRAP
jgi:drug/metabolite transporter (DMT)-like permease